MKTTTSAEETAKRALARRKRQAAALRANLRRRKLADTEDAPEGSEDES